MTPPSVAPHETGDAAVRAALARVLGSSEFERSGRVRQMLEFLVETTLAVGLSIFATTRPTAPSLQGVRVLFAGGGQPLHPSISPAGDMIAFDWAGPEDSHNAIYVQRMDGTSPIRLTPGRETETWPVWSP